MDEELPQEPQLPLFYYFVPELGRIDGKSRLDLVGKYWKSTSGSSRRVLALSKDSGSDSRRRARAQKAIVPFPNLLGYTRNQNIADCSFNSSLFRTARFNPSLFNEKRELRLSEAELREREDGTNLKRRPLVSDRSLSQDPPLPEAPFPPITRTYSGITFLAKTLSREIYVLVAGGIRQNCDIVRVGVSKGRRLAIGFIRPYRDAGMRTIVIIVDGRWDKDGKEAPATICVSADLDNARNPRITCNCLAFEEKETCEHRENVFSDGTLIPVLSQILAIDSRGALDNPGYRAIPVPTIGKERRLYWIVFSRTVFSPMAPRAVTVVQREPRKDFGKFQTRIRCSFCRRDSLKRGGNREIAEKS